MQFLKFRKYNTKKGMLLFGLFLSFFFVGLPKVKAQKKYKIVLDAGHGGKDPGNLGNGYREKKIVLSVALKVGTELSKEKDIKVIYTRKSDKFIELHNRAKIANSNKADLFVSIHCDAFKKAKAYGAGTFVLGLKGNRGNLEMAKRENAVILLEDNYKSNYDYDPNSPESVIGLSVLQEDNLDESLAFASLVQSNFIKAKRYDRSVKQDNFLVLRETVMPSVLIELGFLTNKAEGKFLNSKSGQTKMAKAIAKAIVKYVNQLKLNTVSEDKQNNIDVKETVSEVKKQEPKKVTPAKTKVNEVAKVKPNTKIKIDSVPKKIVTEKTSTLDNNKTNKLPPQPIKKSQPVNEPIQFKVQIAASRQYLELKPYNFKGLKNVEMKTFSDYFRYYYGSSSNYEMIKEYLQDVKDAGIEGAFIVAFENGVKISTREAIKKQR